MLLNFYSPGYREKKKSICYYVRFFFFSPSHLAIAQAFLLSFKILHPNALVICAHVSQT